MLETTKKPYVPYPPRPSLVDVAAIHATEPLVGVNLEDLQQLDSELYEKCKSINDVEVSDHVIYPDAFNTPSGRIVFSIVYKNPNFWKGMDKEEMGSTIKMLEAISGNEDELIGFAKQHDIQFEEDLDVLKDFFSCDLRRVPKDLRRFSNSYSSRWAEGMFKEEFTEAIAQKNDLPPPPVRIGKLVSPANLHKKIAKYRELKREIKQRLREIDGQDAQGDSNADTTTKAIQIVLQMYQQYINYKIAGLYSPARLVDLNPGKKTPGQRTALKEVASVTDRAMERIDHFLHGIGGYEMGNDNLYVSISQQVADYADELISKADGYGEVYERLNQEHRVNAQTMKQICEVILSSYGWDEGEKPWTVEINPKKRTMIVNMAKRVVYVPKDLDKGLIEALGVATHEIEGHVIRQINSDRLKGTSALNILSELASRSGILSEAGAMFVESQTIRAITGTERSAKPYYYLVLKKKEAGGNFSECFQVYLEAKTKREYGKSPAELMSEQPDLFNASLDEAYSRTLRIFRSHTPLKPPEKPPEETVTNTQEDDDSSMPIKEVGYLENTGQLEYIEQDILLAEIKMDYDNLSPDDMRRRLWDMLLFTKGIDLYSFEELNKLGLLDFEIETPKMVVANQIWPIIKEGLERGIDISDLLGSIKESEI